MNIQVIQEKVKYNYKKILVHTFLLLKIPETIQIDANFKQY